MSGKRKISFKQLTTEFVVGLVFVISMCILGFFTIVLSRDSGLLGDEKASVEIRFTEIGGLQQGDKVLLRGVPIGKVQKLSIRPNDPNKIIVHLQVDPPYSKFGKGYVAEIRSSSALGGRHVYLEQGDLNQPVEQPLAGVPPVDPVNEAGRLARELRKTVVDVSSIAKKLNTDGSTLDRVARDDALYEEALGAMKSLNDSGKQISDAAQELKSLRGDFDAVFEEFKSAGQSITKAGNSVTDAGKSVREAADKVTKTADNIDGAITDAREGKGTVGKLLTDEKMAEDLQQAVQDIRSALAGIGDKKSSIGRLLNDNGELYASIKNAFDEVDKTFGSASDVMAKVNRGEGTLGLLINDESVYTDIKQTIRDVQGAINDFREQAPILTFGSFIFGSL